MLKEETACLTGHRPKSLPWGYDEQKVSCKNFKNDLVKLLKELIESGFKYFLIGMAEGFDMIGGETLIKLRREYKEIKIIAIVPCKNQEIKWTLEQQKRYEKLLKKCNKVIILQEKYTHDCMNKRNKYMVDHASLVIACFNGKPSGTKNTIRFAEENGCEIIIINPNDYN